MMEIINFHEAESQISELLQRVKNGEEFLVMRNGEPVAVLSPIRDKVEPRKLGDDAGKVHILPNFDDPLPEFNNL